jgi:hypothetical protein
VGAELESQRYHDRDLGAKSPLFNGLASHSILEAVPESPPFESFHRPAAMIRPWCRSRLFWLGLPGLLFLLWGSVDWSAPRSFTAQIGDFRLTIGSGARTTRITCMTAPAGSGFAIAGRTGTPASDLISPLPQAVRLSKVDLPRGSRFVSLKVAYWFLVLLYLPLWLGGLAGWQRHKRRLLQAPLAPQA